MAPNESLVSTVELSPPSFALLGCRLPESARGRTDCKALSLQECSAAALAELGRLSSQDPAVHMTV
jgi:hypothetical protein